MTSKSPYLCSIVTGKKAVLALKQNKPVKPYHVFLSGPGGVGKSHVINCV